MKGGQQELDGRAHSRLQEFGSYIGRDIGMPFI